MCRTNRTMTMATKRRTLGEYFWDLLLLGRLGVFAVVVVVIVKWVETMM